MIVKYTGREPSGTGQLLIGNRGDIKATTLIFQVQKIQQGLDLSNYIPSIEWIKYLGGQDIVNLSSTPNSSDSDYLDISWTLSKEIMEFPGRGNICINFLSNTGDIAYRTNNLPIYVKDTINVDETIIPSIPESYRAFIEDVKTNTLSIEQNAQDIENLSSEIEQCNTIEDWIYPTMLNDALTESSNQLRYKKDNLGKTYVIGTIKNTNGSRACFQLVNGYRIEKDISYFEATSKNGNTLNHGMINSDGMVYLEVPDNDVAYINLIFINKGEL